MTLKSLITGFAVMLPLLSLILACMVLFGEKFIFVVLAVLTGLVIELIKLIRSN